MPGRRIAMRSSRSGQPPPLDDEPLADPGKALRFRHGRESRALVERPVPGEVCVGREPHRSLPRPGDRLRQEETPEPTPHRAGSHRELVQARRAVDPSDDHQTEGAPLSVPGQEGEPLGRRGGPAGILAPGERVLGDRSRSGARPVHRGRRHRRRRRSSRRAPPGRRAGSERPGCSSPALYGRGQGTVTTRGQRTAAAGGVAAPVPGVTATVLTIIDRHLVTCSVSAGRSAAGSVTLRVGWTSNGSSTRSEGDISW